LKKSNQTEEIKMLQIIKIGSACLFDDTGKINYDILEKKCQQIKNSEDQTVLVVSGAIALGKYVENDKRSNTELSDVELQGYACSGQVELMQLYSSMFGCSVGQLLVTEADLSYTKNISDLVEYCLSKGQIPIINYNDATDFGELRLDNDALAVRIFEYCSAERLVIFGKYDGFMDYSQNKLVERIYSVNEELYAQCQGQSKHGNGGFFPKLDAGKRILELGKELVIGNIAYDLYDIVKGNVPRTVFLK
jgi:glutamate 5-kinase